MSETKAEATPETTKAIDEARAMEKRVAELTKERIRRRRQTNEHARY